MEDLHCHLLSGETHLVVVPADTEPLVPVVTLPGLAALLLRPPDQAGALALAGLGVEPVHALVGTGVGTATAALRVLLQHHLLPPLLLVPALEVRLDHHLHLLLAHLENTQCGCWVPFVRCPVTVNRNKESN